MPSRLKRLHESKQSHFVTFTCYHRMPNLIASEICEACICALEHSRQKYSFRVYGFVLMPEHVHLLVSEPYLDTLAIAIQSFKTSAALRSAKYRDATSLPMWQKRYYDRNVRDYEEFVEKLRYIHRNPVKRGLVERAEDWPWSSFRHYATGEDCGVEIESEWTARKRENQANNET